MGLSWIISSNNQIKYETEKHYPYWLNKGPCYDRAIFYKLHGTVFENFIRNSRTDRYNIMCSVTAHDKQ